MQGIASVAENIGGVFPIPETLDMDIAVAWLDGSELGNEHGHQAADKQEQSIDKDVSYVVMLNAHVTPGHYILGMVYRSPWNSFTRRLSQRRRPVREVVMGNNSAGHGASAMVWTVPVAKRFDRIQIK